MKRRLHLGLALCAMVAHLGVPVAAYARATTPMLPGDFCSASRGGAMVPTVGGLPMLAGGGLTLPAGGGPTSPSSGEHHCAHAPCCAGGASDGATPPPRAPVVFRAAFAGVRAPTASRVVLQSVVIAAAQPRGPPLPA